MVLLLSESYCQCTKALPGFSYFCNMTLMNRAIRVAILDLNEGHPNQGMRCLRDILRAYGSERHLQLDIQEFEVRLDKQLPGTEFDIYISSGGPGSPLESEGSEWEQLYFAWMKTIIEYNESFRHPDKKNILFICHSFQLACRYFKVGQVAKRKSTSFGVFPIHVVEQQEPVFSGLNDPFYAVDSRDYQVIEPDYSQLEKMGASILAIEKEH